MQCGHVINPTTAGAEMVRAAPGVLAACCVNHPAANLLGGGVEMGGLYRCLKGLD